MSNPAKTSTISNARAVRLLRMLQLLNEGAQKRSTLLARLNIDDRGFFRDLERLRALGVQLQVTRGEYRLEESIEEAYAKLPFPNPQLSVHEVRQLCQGDTDAHRKLKSMLDAFLATPPQPAPTSRNKRAAASKRSKPSS